MMMETGREYAQALYMLAKENNMLREYLNSLEIVLETFEKNPVYIDFLSSVNISKKERIDALDNAFSSNLPEHIVSFLKILCERERIRAFKDCVDEYKALYNFDSKSLTAKIISAVELSDDEKERIVNKITEVKNCSVCAEYVIDESIIGGIIIEIDGSVIDSSIKTRLSAVKEVIEREQ